MSKEVDYSKITLRIKGEEKVFSRGYTPGTLLSEALKFKAKYERLVRNASRDLKKKEPGLSESEHESELMNIMLVDSNYIQDSAELISLSFDKAFSAEDFTSGTSAGELLERCERYTGAAVSGVSAVSDVSEDTENLSEEKSEESN